MNSSFNQAIADTFLVHFQSKQQMKDWIFNFLGLDFPDSHVDPESNASPVDWMYEVYCMYRDNRGNESPEVLVISSRESYKTLSEAVFAIICMSHFGAMIAHMAAIVPQASAAQKYTQDFLIKIAPYLAYHKITIDSQNSKEIVINMADNSKAYLKIIVCTLTGANSSHTNLFTIDEIDTIRSQEGIRAYKEAQMIPGVFNGQHPITIKTSTLKFPGGLFMKEWDRAKREQYKIFKWNLIDITEYCPPERHRPDLPMEERFIGNSLPLRSLTKDQYDQLTDKEKPRFTRIEAKGGCAKCPLLPVCKGRLAHRNPNDRGGLWKPIDFTISQFKKTDPDLAESQLMCWKPSSQGMVYPRFLDTPDGENNTLTVAQAWEAFTGMKADKNIDIKTLIDTMLAKGVKFYAAVDWGHSHAFAITVSCIVLDGQWWLVDTYSVPGLEFEQMMDLAKSVRDRYKIIKWFPDNSEPMFIKAFRKNRMPCVDFTKDVRGGIELARGQIVDASDRRRMKVIKHERNDMLLRMFAEHTFKLDSNGNLTDEPDDSEVADVGDTVRYQAQNLFDPKSKARIPTGPVPVTHQEYAAMNRPTTPAHQDWLSQKVRELTGGANGESQGKDKSGTVIWDFGDGNE